MADSLPSDLRVAVDGELKPADIDAPRLVLVRKLNRRGEPVGDFAYVAYWATDDDPAEQDRNAEYLARAVNSYAALVECAEALQEWRYARTWADDVSARARASRALAELEAL